ncbi:MAG: hypothetical protein AAFY59_09910 [Pseudomonadota bacterium]
MPILRRPLATRLARLAPFRVELLLIAAFAFIALRLGYMAAIRESLISGGIAALFGVAALLLANTLRQRARFGGAASGLGVVEITEARIAYFSPAGGAFLDRDALTSVDLEHREPGPVWRLAQSAGPNLVIPHGAAGTEALLDLFAALPGFDLETALRRLEHKPARKGPIWGEERALRK